jgi:hypothetical protein
MIKVKELNDDVILDIKVNKSFYLMAKAASVTLLQQINIEEKGEDYITNLTTKKYEDMDDMERAFYTIILMIAEIERQATELKLYTEKEILVPGDEGYVSPTPEKD